MDLERKKFDDRSLLELLLEVGWGVTFVRTSSEVEEVSFCCWERLVKTADDELEVYLLSLEPREKWERGQRNKRTQTVTVLSVAAV